MNLCKLSVTLKDKQYCFPTTFLIIHVQSICLQTARSVGSENLRAQNFRACKIEVHAYMCVHENISDLIHTFGWSLSIFLLLTKRGGTLLTIEIAVPGNLDNSHTLWGL